MQLTAWEGGPRRLLFTVHGKPEPEGNLRSAPRKGGGINTWHANQKDLRPWRANVAWEARAALTGPVLDGPLGVEVIFTLRRPPSAPKRRRYPTVKPDLDKLARGVLDALTDSGVWKDDALVVRLAAEKTYVGADDALDAPGALITVTEIDP